MEIQIQINDAEKQLQIRQYRLKLARPGTREHDEAARAVAVQRAVCKTLNYYRKMCEWGNAVINNKEAEEFAKKEL